MIGVSLPVTLPATFGSGHEPRSTISPRRSYAVIGERFGKAVVHIVLSCSDADILPMLLFQSYPIGIALKK